MSLTIKDQMEQYREVVARTGKHPADYARERLAALINKHVLEDGAEDPGHDVDGCVAAIMREFALRPVAQGVVDSETGEVATASHSSPSTTGTPAPPQPAPRR